MIIKEGKLINKKKKTFVIQSDRLIVLVLFNFFVCASLSLLYR